MSVKAAVERAGIDPAEVEDVIMGCANPEGATGGNIARQIALRAGLPVTVSGVTVNRFCSCGLQTIAMAAQRIIVGEGEVYRGRRRGEHLLRAAGDEPPHAASTLAGREQARDLLEHAADRRAGGQALQHRPRAQDEYGAASQQKACGGAGSRAVQGRDRADHRDCRRGRRGDGPAQQGGHRRRRRRHPRRHHLRGHQRHPPGDARRRDHGRQREPVQRRRRRLRGDGRDARRAARA